MNDLLFDIETDGLLETLTTVWCAVTLNLQTQELLLYTTLEHQPSETDGFQTLSMSGLIPALKNAKSLTGHNIVGFDLPALFKISGTFEVPPVLDTLTLSRFLRPERWGGHSLGAWGERLGHPKIEFNEWHGCTPEMEAYCAQDVMVNLEVYNHLQEEWHEDTLPRFKTY